MVGRTLAVGLLREVFHDDPEGERLRARLAEARAAGAELVVLPELPLNTWCPATDVASDEDRERPDGPRQARLAEAARAAGVAVLGGAIIRSPRSGRRFNTAILYDREGHVLGSYRKVHLPDEEGFWEGHHYEPGTAPPSPIEGLALRVGIQICSDIQRPQGIHLLAAAGADVVLAPRATETATFDRWRTVLIANAMTAAVYVVSVPRPGPEAGVGLGGPSIVVGPDGVPVLETEQPLAVVDLDRHRVARARQGYPGYLTTRPDLYALGWSRLAAEIAAASAETD